MENNNLSSRENLAGAVMTNVMQQPDRKAWDKAMAALSRANAASDAYEVEYWQIEAAYKAAIEAVPHVTVPNPDRGTALTTANRMHVEMARSSAASLRYVEACAYEGVKENHAFLVAVDEREAVIAEINRQFDWDAVNDRYDALSEAISEAESVLLAMPAPDGEAVLWKVQRLYSPGEGIWAEGYEDQTHSDLHRLLANGRA